MAGWLFGSCVFIFGFFLGPAFGAEGNASSTFELTLFDFQKDYDIECYDEARHCYSIMELVEHALRYGLDSREQIQLLFQAKAQARIKLGLLLPQLDPINAASSVTEGRIGLDGAGLFVGFLFPSRWLEYRSAQALKRAQEESIAVSFANVAQAVITIYYQIQMQIWSIRILQFYIDETKRLIYFLEHCDEAGTKLTLEDIATLQSIRAKFEYDLAIIDSLSYDLPRLAMLLGFDPKIDWSTLKLNEHVIANIPEKEASYYDFFDTAEAISPELKNVDHLIEAAKAQKRSTYFQFVDPIYTTTFGFGYGYSIKIARANLSLLDISRQRTRMQLSLAIQNALNNYNNSIEILPVMTEALGRLRDMKPSVEAHINDLKEPLDMNRISRFFEYASGQALRYVSAYFILRTTEAELNRYTWSGGVYDLVIDYRLNEVPRWLKKVEEEHSWRHLLKKRFKKHKPDALSSPLRAS